MPQCINLNLQFYDNGLIPLEILRKIEEKYESDDKKLDNAFDSFNQCAGKGQKWILKFNEGLYTLIL